MIVESKEKQGYNHTMEVKTIVKHECFTYAS